METQTKFTPEDLILSSLTKAEIDFVGPASIRDLEVAMEEFVKQETKEIQKENERLKAIDIAKEEKIQNWINNNISLHGKIARLALALNQVKNCNDLATAQEYALEALTYEE